MTRVLTVSDDTHTGVLPSYPVFTEDASGRFFMTSARHDQIIVFDAEGRIRSFIGGRGQDAGKFQMITNLLGGPDNSLLVYDGRLRMLTTIGRDLALLASVPARYRPDLVRADGHFIVAQQIPSRELVGQPIHLVDGDGKIIRSFGADVAELRPDRALLNERLVAPGPNDSIWAVPPGRYVIERWNPLAGTKLSQIVVRSDWFRESGSLNADERVRPNPIIEALWEMDGLLWIRLRDADANWRPPPRANIERPVELEEYDRTFDSVLEVVRIDSGQVLASRRFDTALWGRAPSFLLVSRRSIRDGGTLQLDVWRPQLRSREGHQ